GPRLFIKNTCKPCPVGGVCSCRVTLVNEGREAPTQPVGFSSAATILSGPKAGTVTAVQRSTPDPPPRNFRPRPSNRYDCMIDGAALPPGAHRSVDLLIRTGELAESGNIGLNQCARMMLQNGDVDGQEVCVETGTDITVALTGASACVAGAPCASQTTIT